MSQENLLGKTLKFRLKTVEFLPVTGTDRGREGCEREQSLAQILEDISLLSTMGEGMSSYRMNRLDPSQIFDC